MRFITLKKEQNNSSTCSAFTSSALIHLIFHFSFFDGGRKNIFFPKAQGTVATPLTARLVTSIQKHQQRWALDLDLQINFAKWKMVYINNYSCTLETKLRSFQLKLNHS